MLKIKLTFISIIVLGCLISSTGFAWSKQGHMVIADIAYGHLLPAKKKKLDSLLATLQQGKGLQAMLRASTWADDLRFKNIKTYDRWHYIRLPIIKDKLKFTPYVPEPNVLTSSIRQLKLIQDKSNTKKQKAAAIRMLIHLIGDMHQPLHTATLYDKSHPKGDLNGLKYRLKSRYKNLHRFWDVGGGILAYKKRKPFRRQKLIQSIEKQYPYQEKFLQISPGQSIQLWVGESFKLAKKDAYQQKPNSKVSPEYRKLVNKDSRKQLVQAGYHLAQLLNTLL